MVWGSQDIWRQHPLISRGYKAAFPGLRLAVPAFAAFVVLEGVGKVIFGSGDGHHGASHVQYEKSAIGSTPEVAEH
jgi:hypothetical protein|tara:strand:+ start:415 stop:642 length:228 start_codon:yes stop_codon:yes gene_type:complete